MKLLKKKKKLRLSFKKVVDTHIVNDNGDTIEEMCCDDTEVIEEHLQRCKVFANYHSTIANTLRKYQKIQEIMAKRPKDMISSNPTLRAISEVIEDGI